MSYITDIARTVLGQNLYQECLNNLYGMRTNIDLLKEFNRYMIIQALDWNDSNDYYTQAQLDCLNGKIHRKPQNPDSKNPQSVVSGSVTTR